MENRNEKRRFCSACGAPLTGTPFCGECGAKVPTTTIQIPVIAEAEPVYVEEMAAATEPVPVVVAPAVEIASEPEPVVIPETVVQITSRPWRLPVASVILMGIVAAWLIIQLFISPYSAWSGVVHACCASAVLVGMIVCQKKRNLIVGFAFLAYACAQMTAFVINMLPQFKSGLDVSAVLMTAIVSAIYCIWYAAFGISYLVAKPKIAILKNIMGGFLTGFGLLGVIAMGILLITGGNRFSAVMSFLSYLLYFMPMGLSVILYTPFKKR